MEDIILFWIVCKFDQSKTITKNTYWVTFRASSFQIPTLRNEHVVDKDQIPYVRHEIPNLASDQHLGAVIQFYH